MIPIRDSIPTQRFPLVNWLLIIANILVFVYQAGLDQAAAEDFVYRWSVLPVLYNPRNFGTDEVFNALPRLVTCTFLHGGALHLVGNMWALYIFGDNIEGRLGPLNYLFFYLFCGAVASGAHVYMTQDSVIPLVGASGAIAGVLGAYLMAFPHARILTLFWFLIFLQFAWIPAFVYLALWFLLDLSRALLTTGAGPGVAYWAHVGGFVAGALLLRLNRRRHPDDWIVTHRREAPRVVIIRPPRRHY